MAADHRHQTHRAAPLVEGAAGRLAERLRRESERVDEVSQARMERALYEAWRTRGAADVTPAQRGARAGRPGLAVWGASVAVAAAAGALLAVVMWQRDVVPANLSAAQYELRLGESATQRGTLQQGETLETGALGDVDVAVGYSRLQMGRRGALRLDRVATDALEMTLLKGRVDVAFHPPEKGVQTLAIETRTARVRVVGTRFSVELDGRGNTRVAVTEGVVEVTSRVDGEVHRIAAGERVEVQRDPGDSVERAVREAIEEDVAAVAPDMDLTQVLLGDEPDAQQPARRKPAPSARPRPSRVLSQAREMLRAGNHGAARGMLDALARSGASPGHRAEAYTLIAESYTAQGYVPRAEQAYRSAASAAPQLAAGQNASFALGRLLERFKQDHQGARDAYLQYLQRAPRGPLAPQARRALCRLGDASHCK